MSHAARIRFCLMTSWHVVLSAFLFPPVLFAALADIDAGADALVGDQWKPEDRIELQQKLKDAGVDPGKIDGILGKKTFEAIRRFKAMRGLASDRDDPVPHWTSDFKKALLGGRGSEPAPIGANAAQKGRASGAVSGMAPSVPSRPVMAPTSAGAPAPGETNPLATPSAPSPVAPAVVQQAPPPATQNVVVTNPPVDISETVGKLKALDAEIHDQEKGIKHRLDRLDESLNHPETGLRARQKAFNENLGEKIEKVESRLDNYFWIFVGSIISAALGLLGAAWNYSQTIESKVENRVDKAIGTYLEKYGDLEKTVKERLIGAEENLTVHIKEMENEVDCNRRNIAETETQLARIKSELEVAASRVEGKNDDLRDSVKKLDARLDTLKNGLSQARIQQESLASKLEQRVTDIESLAKSSQETAELCKAQLDKFKGALS